MERTFDEAEEVDLLESVSDADPVDIDETMVLPRLTFAKMRLFPVRPLKFAVTEDASEKSIFSTLVSEKSISKLLVVDPDEDELVSEYDESSAESPSKSQEAMVSTMAPAKNEKTKLKNERDELKGIGTS